ncbi:MAG TPA: hypothetical protein VNE38_12295 [Ktedonobacteraceae bacterium]|nr:hypothetical protein [Ktedonobacteraceae bacterium]
MITCYRCGKQVPAGLARCQNCGTPVSSVGKEKTDTQDQAELPAWLESLRANERPSAPAGTQQSFSTADLIDEDDLPGWMRADQANGMSDSNKHPAIRPASVPAPNTDAGMMRPGGFSASELIDPTALPSWMQPNRSPANPPAPAVSMGANDVRVYPQGVTPAPAPGMRAYPETPSHLLKAEELIDRQSLPAWMTGQMNQPARQVNQAPAPWQGGSVPQVPPRSEDNGQQSSLAASSLLDMNSLPTWLREGQQAQGNANMAGQQGQLQGNGLAAGSLIDMNALPSWLRAADGQSQAAPGGNISPAAYGGPGRIESARVPSRPRAEMMPPEQSEVAANVFSSMLGVASNAPYYPAQMPGGQQSFQNAPAQQSGSLYASQAMPPAASPSGFGSGQSMPGGYAGNYQNAQNPYATYPGGNQAAQQMPLQQQAQYPANQPGPVNTGQSAPTNQNDAKAGKRSFLDTIREWFHL